jgi:hypothetical protein
VTKESAEGLGLGCKCCGTPSDSGLACEEIIDIIQRDQGEIVVLLYQPPQKDSSSRTVALNGVGGQSLRPHTRHKRSTTTQEK